MDAHVTGINAKRTVTESVSRSIMAIVPASRIRVSNASMRLAA